MEIMKLVTDLKKRTYFFRPKIVYYKDFTGEVSGPVRWHDENYFESKKQFYDFMIDQNIDVKVFEWEVKLLPETYDDFWFEEEDYSNKPPNCS